MADENHDLFLVYGETRKKKDLPLILVVGREPNNPHPFSSTIGYYPLEAQVNAAGKKKTYAFWDQAYGTVAKATSTGGPEDLKAIARDSGASPIVFTDVMPAPAEYKAGGHSPRLAREGATEESMQAHVAQVFSMREIIDRVCVVVLAGHRHGSFSRLERTNLGRASDLFEERCRGEYRSIPVPESVTSEYECNMRTSNGCIRSSQLGSVVASLSEVI